MSDSSDRPSPGPNVLVLRAAFVPEGQPPPPEFGSVFHSLRFRATLDPRTGMITCDDSGMSFLGDIRAEWHPDPVEDQGSNDGEDGDVEGWAG